MTLFIRELLNIKKRQSGVALSLPSFNVLKDFIEHVPSDVNVISE